MRIAAHHALRIAAKDADYTPRHDWPGETLVQWGAGGIVLGEKPYRTAFFEAFPDEKVSAAGGFIRGEGETIAEAEDKAHAKFVRQNSCNHLWGREHYRNSGQLCRHCRAFRSGHVKEVVILGRHRKPLEWYDAHMLEDLDVNKKYARIMRLRAKLFGVTERPSKATGIDAVVASFVSKFATIATVMAAALAAVILGLDPRISPPAQAHEAPSGWKYPYECCSDQDCKPASHVEVRETRAGYLVVATGEVVPLMDRRVKDSPDGDFHLCQVGGDFDHGKVLCLFRPPQSF